MLPEVTPEMLCFRFAPWSRHRWRCGWLLLGLALTWSTNFEVLLTWVRNWGVGNKIAIK